MTDESPKLTKKQQVFIDEYLKCFNATQAALVAGYSEKTAYSIGWENLRKPEIKAEIDARLDEVHMSANEALKLQADVARGDIGVFFKIIDEWMFNPLPSYEILDEREVIDEEAVPPKKRISYRVRHVALDMDKVTDPRYSHLIKEFSDSRRSGLGIKLHDAQEARQTILKVAGKFTDKVDVTTNGESLKPEEMKPSEIAARVVALLKAKDANNG